MVELAAELENLANVILLTGIAAQLVQGAFLNTSQLVNIPYFDDLIIDELKWKHNITSLKTLI